MNARRRAIAGLVAAVGAAPSLAREGKTARTLGLPLPPELVLRATRIIE